MRSRLSLRGSHGLSRSPLTGMACGLRDASLREVTAAGNAQDEPLRRCDGVSGWHVPPSGSPRRSPSLSSGLRRHPLCRAALRDIGGLAEDGYGTGPVDAAHASMSQRHWSAPADLVNRTSTVFRRCCLPVMRRPARCKRSSQHYLNDHTASLRASHTALDVSIWSDRRCSATDCRSRTSRF